LSLDNTFKILSKAVVVGKGGTHLKLMKGGVLDVMNEEGDVVAWVRVGKLTSVTKLNSPDLQRFCQSASPVETQEVLDGINSRCAKLGVPAPTMVVVDNCCIVQNHIVKALPGSEVVLDVYHFIARSVSCCINRTLI
jgi:hypothetical protein